MTTPYRPIQFSNEQITRPRLQQLVNNVQWLFESTPRMRYAVHALVRDNGLKIMAGKTRYMASTKDWSDTTVYFGNFFSAGSRPVITATVGDPGAGARKYVSIRGFNSAEIDHNGFIAQVVQYEPAAYPRNIRASGWVHWHAIGF